MIIKLNYISRDKAGIIEIYIGDGVWVNPDTYFGLTNCFHQYRELYYGSNRGIMESPYKMCFKCKRLEPIDEGCTHPASYGHKCNNM